MTKEDANQPAVVSSLVEEDEAYGIVKPDGSINWDCPCLGEQTLIDAIYLRVVQCHLLVCWDPAPFGNMKVCCTAGI